MNKRIKVLHFDTKDTQRRKDVDGGGTQCKQSQTSYNNTFNDEVLTYATVYRTDNSNSIDTQ